MVFRSSSMRAPLESGATAGARRGALGVAMAGEAAWLTWDEKRSGLGADGLHAPAAQTTTGTKRTRRDRWARM
jgi:hypothetical protein